MAFSEKQKGVVKGVSIGAVSTLAFVIAGAWFNPFHFDGNMNEVERLGLAIKSVLVPGLFLGLSVGRLARHRFFTPQDIDGGGLTNGTHEARILQSLLQNTLEQFALAFAAYLAWAVIMPVLWLSVVPLAAIAFGIGRVLFFAGYKEGAPHRAVGFALTFYPSMVMLVLSMAELVRQF